jgi:hypothetical protein
VRVAVIVRASRPNYKNVISDLLRSTSEFPSSVGHSLRLYISADDTLKLMGPYRLSTPVESKFEAVRYIFDDDRQVLVSKVVHEQLGSRRLGNLLFLNKPYSYQLNSALAYAIADSNDLALLFDDDQSFRIPVALRNSSVVWRYTDVIGSHIRALKNGAAVTTGPIVGSVSPIPESITATIPTSVRRRLGRLFEGAHEFVNENTFVNPRCVVPSSAEVSRMTFASLRKPIWVSPANMGVDLRHFLPPFFNPPGARGEDAFFALGLAPGASVVSVPAFIFHDPFLRYTEVHRGHFPTTLDPEPVTPASVNRLADALIGWLRYVPLFLLCKWKHKSGAYEAHLRRKQALVESLSPILASRLGSARLLEMASNLELYSSRVSTDYENWLAVNATWRERIIPWLWRERPCVGMPTSGGKEV